MKTPTLTAAEFRKMCATDYGWGASIEPDGSVWLTIPGDPVSLNQWTRQHWAKTRKMLLKMTAEMQILKSMHRLPCFDKAEVRIVYYFRTNRRRDQDNYAPKQLLDSMRKADILADDNAEVLRLLPVELRVDKERPRTEVFVREWVG
jgi:Holliday junction resolvase RusA-like endonuclease